MCCVLLVKKLYGNCLFWLNILHWNFFHLSLKNRVCRKVFHCIEYMFYHSGFLSNLRLPWKTEMPCNFSLYWVYFYIQEVWATFPRPEKQRVPWKFSLFWTSFSSFRISEQLTLALKTEFALNSLYWIYIFYCSGLLSILRLPWKTELPWNFPLHWNIFYCSGFFTNARLPWKQILRWIFSRRGAAPPPRPPASYTYAQNVSLNVLKRASLDWNDNQTHIRVRDWWKELKNHWI